MSNSLLTDEDFEEISQYLETQQKRRRRLVPRVLSFKMLGSAIGKLDVTFSGDVLLQVNQQASVLEIWSEDEAGEILIKSCLLLYDTHGLVEKRIPLWLRHKFIFLQLKNGSEVQVTYNSLHPINVFYTSVDKFNSVLVNLPAFPKLFRRRLKKISLEIGLIIYKHRLASLVATATLIFILFGIEQIPRMRVQAHKNRVCIALEISQAISNEDQECFKISSSVEDNIEILVSKKNFKSDLDGLIVALNKLNQEDPDYIRLLVKAQLYLSYLTRSNDGLEEALKKLDAITVSQQPEEDFLIKGYILIKLSDNDNEDKYGNETEKAVEVFKKGYEMYPQSPDLQIGLANAYHYCMTDENRCISPLLMPSRKDIEKLFLRGIEAKEKTKTESWRDYDDLAEFYITVDNYQPAIINSEKAASKSILGYPHLIERQMQLGCFDLVEKKYNEFKKIHNELKNLQRSSESESFMLKSEFYESIEQELNRLNIDYYIADGKYKEAIEILEQLEKTQDNHELIIWIKSRLGDAYFGLGMMNQAKMSYQNALDLASSDKNVSTQCRANTDEEGFYRCVFMIEYSSKLYLTDRTSSNKARLYDSAGWANGDEKNIISDFNSTSAYKFACALAYLAIDKYKESNEQLELIVKHIEDKKIPAIMSSKIRDPAFKLMKQSAGLEKLSKINYQLQINNCSQ